MRKFLIAAGAVVLLVIAAGAAAPFFITADSYRAQIVSRIRDATGRDIQISGPLSLSLFPDVRIEASDVSLANPKGMQTPSLARIRKLDLAVRLRPLLSGRIEIARLILLDPVIDLEIDAKGEPNWAAGLSASGASPATSGLDALSRLDVADLTIENGTILLFDRRNNQRDELHQGNFTLSAPGLDAPFTMTGTAIWGGERLSLAAKLEATGALLRTGGKTGLTVSLAGKPVTVKFTGTAANTGKSGMAVLAFDGDATLTMPSVRDFVNLSGRAIVLPKHGFGPMALSGTVHAEDRVATFTNAKIALDAIAASGTVTLDITTAKPAISGKLQTGMLDLNPYLPPPVRGWSTDKLDIGTIRSVDGDLVIAAQGARFRKIQIGSADIVTHLKDAKLALTVGRMALYRGNSKGTVDVDASSPVAAVRIDGSLSGVDVGALMRDGAGMNAIAGSGNLSVAGTAQGNSERDLIATFGGKASFQLSNGSVGGADLGGMLKNTKDSFGNGGGRTAFTRASASYTVASGIMRNSDLKVSTDTIDATGVGTVNLLDRTLNYRISPKLIAGIVTVDVIVSGPWDRLTFEPDIASIAKGMMMAPANMIGGAADGVGKVGRGIETGVGGALKSLFGN